MAASVLDAVTVEEANNPNGSPTISAGSNRAACLWFWSEKDYSDTAPVVSVMTIGGQSATQSYEEFGILVTNDLALNAYVWNEAKIAAMSGTTIAFTADQSLGSRGWGFITYQGVDQGTFPKGQASTFSSTLVSSHDVTSTSVSGDLVLALSVADRQTANYPAGGFDTLTLLYNSAISSAIQVGAADGNGGDSTTTVTIDTATARMLSQAIVFGAAGTGVVPQAMHHYRNHGKIF